MLGSTPRKSLLLIATMTLLWSQDAAATRIGVVVRASGAGADRAAAFVDHYVRYFLAEDGRYEVIDANEVLGVEDQDARKALLEAAELIQKGKAAYGNMEVEAAFTSFNTALRKYERNSAYLSDVKPVADALALVGALHILLGDEKAGTERLAQALAINPAVEIDPSLFNPAMRQVYQKTADQVKRRAPGSLSITSNPSYAALYVDGVFHGITPASVERLTPGRHYVRLVREGYRSYGNVVTITSGREAAESGVLRPMKAIDSLTDAANISMDVLKNKGDTSEGLPDDSLLRFESLLGAEHLFAVEVRVDTERVRLRAAQYDLKAKRHFKTVSHFFPYDVQGDTFAKEINNLLRTQFGQTTLEKKVIAPGEMASTTCVTPECLRFRKRMLIGGVSGGVALGGIGTVLYILAARDHSKFADVVQESDEAKSLRSSGKTKALIGDVLIPLGVVAVVVGVGTYLFYQPSLDTGGSAPTTSVETAWGVTLLPGGGAMGTAAISF